VLTDYFSEYVAAYRPYKQGAWCYEDGCIYRGLELLYGATGNVRWRDALRRLLERQVGPDGSLAGYSLSDYNIDNILPGRALLFMAAATGEPRYRTAADSLVGQLATHPRTRSGVYWHKLRYPWQIWLDGLYMCHPFQVGYGLRFDRPDLVEDSLRQIALALEATFEPRTGLHAHAFDEARQQAWADPGTGRSRAHWARALGWLAMCLVDVAELVGPQAFRPLEPQSRALFERLLALRQPGGLWLQVIDRPDMAGNFHETSSSAMIAYALRKAARLGLASAPDGMIEAVLRASVRPKPGGGLEMADICEVAGLGAYEHRYRDGSPGYYLTEARVSDDAKGVGPLMMCRALQEQGPAAMAVPLSAG
jgi:unsaturated rhamnogalacturonyl hydrolase